MTTTHEPAPVATFLDLVTARRIDDATQLALRRVEAGERPQDVIRTLLIPAQIEVGNRWHRATWTVAHEHQATAVTDAALHRIVSAVRPRAYRASLAVVCAEGDWHTLPSRMAAELLRLDGWKVTFLGGPVPTPDLASWLLDARPDAVIVTCSMPTFGRGVLNIARAATVIGIPVVAGGHGMGPDPRRATALGVRWAPQLTDLERTLAAATAPADPAEHITRLTASDYTDLHREDIIHAAMLELDRSWPMMRTLDPRQRARTAENLSDLVDHITAATLMDDNRIFTEFLDWLAVLHTARGIPPDLVTLSVRALTNATPPQLRAAHTILTAATDRIK